MSNVVAFPKPQPTFKFNVSTMILSNGYIAFSTDKKVWHIIKT